MVGNHWNKVRDRW